MPCGGFPSHGGTPFYHPDFPMEINHPAIKGYPHDLGNFHKPIRLRKKGCHLRSLCFFNGESSIVFFNPNLDSLASLGCQIQGIQGHGLGLYWYSKMLSMISILYSILEWLGILTRIFSHSNDINDMLKHVITPDINAGKIIELIVGISSTPYSMTLEGVSHDIPLTSHLYWLYSFSSQLHPMKKPLYHSCIPLNMPFAKTVAKAL